VYPGAQAELTPDKPALVMADTGETVTYAQLEERSVRLAHLLHDHGLRPGDSFALLSENSPRYHECYWAALRSGLYLTGLNIHLALEEQLHIPQDCGCPGADRLGHAGGPGPTTGRAVAAADRAAGVRRRGACLPELRSAAPW
jgi:acyl-CoA synthetase (AMP-forming)/AMP-acid ligase II